MVMEYLIADVDDRAANPIRPKMALSIWSLYGRKIIIEILHCRLTLYID